MSEIITDVPADWKIQRLKNVCTLRKRTKLPPLREIANIPMELIPEDGLYTNFIMKSLDDIKSGDICKEGDILLAGITPSFENGKQGIVPPLPSKYAITTTEAFPLICGSDVESHFIYNLLKYEFTRRIIASRMEGSTGRQRVPSDVLMNFLIPVPPLVEQRGIVEVLGTVDESIRLTDAVIERAEELKRGLMQQLLTRGIGHTEYKESPVGDIPETWDVDKLGSFFKLSSGESRPKNMSDFRNKENDYPVYGGNGIFGYTSKTNNFDTTIIIGRVGAYCGAVHFAKGYKWITDNALYLREFKKEINLSYLYYLLNYMKLNQFSKRSGQPLITQKIIENIKFGLPPIEEQNRISSILIEIDNYLSTENKLKITVNEIKKSLMQVLLSGKTRVELKGDGLHRIGDGREANY